VFVLIIVIFENIFHKLLWCGGIFDNLVIANFLHNVPVKEF